MAAIGTAVVIAGIVVAALVVRPATAVSSAVATAVPRQPVSPRVGIVAKAAAIVVRVVRETAHNGPVGVRATAGSPTPIQIIIIESYSQ